MRVVLRAEVADTANVRGWLKAGKDYTVLSVEAAGAGVSANVYRIQSDDNATPALFEAKLFRLVDARIPSCWIVVQQDDLPIQLMPASWAEDGYWERFFDGDPAARREYEAITHGILAELG